MEWINMITLFHIVESLLPLGLVGSEPGVVGISHLGRPLRGRAAVRCTEKRSLNGQLRLYIDPGGVCFRVRIAHSFLEKLVLAVLCFGRCG